MKNLLLVIGLLAHAMILEAWANGPAGGPTPLEKARALFQDLPEAQVGQVLGNWKMAAFIHSKSKSFRSRAGGLLVEGFGPYASAYKKTMEIGLGHVHLGEPPQYLVMAAFRAINTDDDARQVKAYYFADVGPNNPLPRPEVHKRKFLHCKALSISPQDGKAQGLLCQLSGISSASLYLSCFIPLAETGLGPCDL